ncbi:MAG: hypothetical protein HYY67_06560 [Thaumarchaeota archaeon]|nr:hypothetical protein [Nitrososphaerota archaeon]
MHRSNAYQILLFVVAIAGVVVLLSYFPEPRPLFPAPLPDSLVLINATIISPSDRVIRLYPAARVNVSFHAVVGGEISEHGLQVITDTRGLAQIGLYGGKYVVKTADWTPQSITIDGDSILSIRRFEIEDSPKIRINATSKDWVISPADRMKFSYVNEFGKTILLSGITFQGRAIESIRCKSAEDLDNSKKCSTTVEIQPREEWSEIFENPYGGSIAWNSARRLTGVTLHLSFVEADVMPTQRIEG